MGWNCAGSSCDSYGRGFMTRAEKVEMLQEYQKIDAPPHSKECGLNGARFLDAQSVHTLKGVVLDQTLWHKKNLDNEAKGVAERIKEISSKDE